MCSRGTVRITTIQMSNKLGIPLRDTARQWEHPHPDTGMIFPNEHLPTIVLDGTKPTLAIKMWGIKSSRDGKLMRNARAETVDSLPTWAPMFQNRRCVIPFTGFMEWTSEWSNAPKAGYQFSLDEEEQEPMLLAGIYDEVHRLVILTVDANETVAPIHPRMPAILSETGMALWLHPWPTRELQPLKRLLVPYRGQLYSKPLERVA